MSAYRATKRPKTTHYRDRIPLENDIEVIHSRSSGLTSWNAPNVASRSPLKGRTTWTVGKSWAPDDDEEIALDDSSAWFDEEVHANVFDSHPSRMDDLSKKKKRTRSKVSLRPHVVWKDHHRAAFLDESLRLEGRGDFARENKCSDCAARKRDVIAQPEYRCVDCFLPDLTCKDCCVKRHQRLPFHVIERWTGETFVKVSLKSLGLAIHLNHSSLRCPIPIACHQDLRILHTNGIHDVAISYCGCPRSIPQHTQLLRRRLYPATQIAPRTCVTFELLRLLHLLSLTSKASTYDFYLALERLTDNAGTNRPKSRYRPLLRVGLQWRHLKMLKRAGRGHDEAGVAGTKDGELAIQCPSCPHPGINLPADWKDVPDDQKFLYRLLVCMDANFRLKNQLVSNYSQDPGLGTGWAYMVRTKPYEDYVLSKASDEDISTCVSFLAIVLALTRFSKGLRYTGVGGAFCGRGEMFLPNGVGNLQKGERYANMDYILGSSVRNTQLESIGISYDICCQWYTNLQQRMTSWPQEIQLPPNVTTTPLIPKFHEPAHNDKNHEQYSFNHVVGVGNTDGECPERAWAGHNGLGNATKTQGPGSRHDVLDDHFGFWNWRKYCNMGNTLIRRYKSAIMERNKQVEAHRGFTASLPEDLVTEWELLCAAWDLDSVPKSQPNPYSVEGSEMSETQVHEELRKDEGRIRAGGRAVHHTMGPADFIRMGLELEAAQRKLRVLSKEQGNVPKSLQGPALKEQRTRLSKNVQDWELIRNAYMPGLLQYQMETGVGGPTVWDGNPSPEDVDLFLPSQLPDRHRSTVCIEGLAEIEEKYRTAQCHDALDALRRALRIKTRMILFKNKNIRGQVQSTRSRALIDRVHQRALASVDKYRVARLAKMKLCGPGAWEDALRPLLNSDVRSYSDPRRNTRGRGRRGIWEDGCRPEDVEVEGDGGVDDVEDIEPIPRERDRRDGTGRTTHEISWIWMVNGSHSDADGQDGAEIMRRSGRGVELAFNGVWRKSRSFSRKCAASSHISIGRSNVSYAKGQAAMHASLSESFIQAWRTPLGMVDETAVDEEDEANASNTAERDGLDPDDVNGDGEDNDSDREDDTDGEGRNTSAFDAEDVFL
ncbi:hypothetical protein BJ912DRAFT_1054149 [Pholiota molesta]|nr:hypothetical protein BJ912DRAFT_1054149 [Pholiota molesta]